MKRKTNKRKGIFGKTETVVRTPKEKRKAAKFVEQEKLRAGIKDK
jgi:hypothetical protein